MRPLIVAAVLVLGGLPSIGHASNCSARCRHAARACKVRCRMAHPHFLPRRECSKRCRLRELNCKAHCG